MNKVKVITRYNVFLSDIRKLHLSISPRYVGIKATWPLETIFIVKFEYYE